MPDSKVRWNSVCGKLPFLILPVSCLLSAAPILANIPRTATVKERANIKPATSTYQLYQTIGQIFWDAEHQLQERVDPFFTNLSPYKSPLSKSAPLYQKYFQVEQMADEYIQFLDDRKQILDGSQKSPLPKGDLGGFPSESWTLPPTLYLGGIAAFTIGDYASAQKYFSRLLENHAEYKRYSYIGDNYTPDPDFAQPAKPGITKLLFYSQLVMAYGNATKTIVSLSEVERQQKPTSTSLSVTSSASLSVTSNPFTAFQQFNKTSQKVLLSQVTFAHWLANRPYRSQRRNFFNEYYGDQPDQRRASALPKTAKLIQTGWQNLFPAALKKSGPLGMRRYLRTLTTEDASLHDIAATHLAEVDQLVIKNYFAQAKIQLRKKNFAATRKKYQRIIAEYPHSEASRRAERELPKTVPIAVNYYQKVANDNFHPTKIGVPQNKAAIYYEKMFFEDKSGPKADQALYYWARALGTAGKVKEEVKLLQQHLETFPQSKLRAQAMYLLGFTYINHGLRDYKRGIPLLLQVAADFPQSPQAPEALWNAAFVLGWNKQYQQAIPLLQQLKKQYPKSPRTKWADEWIAKYKEGDEL